MSEAENENVLLSEKSIKIPTEDFFGFRSLLLFDHIFYVSGDEVLDEECCMCCEPLKSSPDAVYLSLCRHQFHLDCLRKLFLRRFPHVCPYCKHIYATDYRNLDEGLLHTEVYKNEIRMSFEVKEYKCVITFENDEDTETLAGLLMKAFQRQLLTKSVLETFINSHPDEQIDVIKTTLKDKNVVENKVNENLDDYDHQKDEDEKRNISLDADNIELTEDQWFGEDWCDAVEAGTPQGQEGNAIEVIISQRQNDANNIDFDLFEPIDPLPEWIVSTHYNGWDI
ncbi:hypothetical protein HELRODRAFT_180282 [Helobdella robusta]|uniref:E3 ubiquitin-protein ligase n=1 Tax=Helobdella robusta TaxID=6412 RepID=T1FFP1_HELRO|nr:hypothetical protein HELRODRAFT_180282 [Helobdella robusta]ESN94113.1 hypothetical protein HELRODRAFT_180282 [Helobdella robusta]